MNRKVKNILLLVFVIIGSIGIYGFTSNETNTTSTTSLTGIDFDDVEIAEVIEHGVSYFDIKDFSNSDYDSELPRSYEVLRIRLQESIKSMENIESVEISFSASEKQVQSVSVELQITKGKDFSDSTQTDIKRRIAYSIENMSEEDVFISII